MYKVTEPHHHQSTHNPPPLSLCHLFHSSFYSTFSCCLVIGFVDSSSSIQVAEKCTTLSLFQCCIVFHCASVPKFFYLLICCWTFGLFPDTCYFAKYFFQILKKCSLGHLLTITLLFTLGIQLPHLTITKVPKTFHQCLMSSQVSFVLIIIPCPTPQSFLACLFFFFCMTGIYNVSFIDLKT